MNGKERNTDTPEAHVKNKKSHQAKLISCTACYQLKALKNVTINLLNELDNIIKSECSCKDEFCCCQEALDVLLKSKKCEVPTESNDDHDMLKMNDENFALKFNGEKILHFCLTCVQYSNTSSQWSQKGWECKTGLSVARAKQKHLHSVEHKKAVIAKDSHTKTYDSNIPKIVFLENQMQVVQMMCEENLSYRSYPKICELLQNVTDNLGPKRCNPVGNRNHSHENYKKHVVALHEAIRRDMHESDKEKSIITGLTPKYAIAYDKGTAFKDGTRQVIVGSKIGKTGEVEEFLISVGVLEEGGAVGGTNHIISMTEGKISKENIVFGSSDSENYYSGNEGGVGTRLVNHPCFSKKYIWLPDVCHNLERLLLPCDAPESENWVDETIKRTKVLQKLMTSSKITRYMKQYAEIDSDVSFYIPQAFSETRFIEHSHKAIISIFRNLDILRRALPDIIHLKSNMDKDTVDTARQIYDLINDSSYVAKLGLLSKLFNTVAKTEQMAQAKVFGAFEFLTARSRLLEALKTIHKETLHEYQSIVDVNKYVMKISTGKKTQTITVDRNENFFQKSLRSEKSGRKIVGMFKDYVKRIISDFDKYFGTPEVIEVANKLFTFDNRIMTDTLLDTKVAAYVRLFELCNTEFKPCSTNCLGLVGKCSCISDEIKRFFNYISLNFPKEKDGSILAKYFLSEENVVPITKLNIVNVLRLLEVTMLMKSTQSSTERVVSRIKRTVSNRFENVYKFSRREKDYVDMENFISFNSSMQMTQAKFANKAASIYLNDLKGLDAIRKTKPSYEKSVVLQTRNNSTERKPAEKRIHSIAFSPLENETNQATMEDMSENESSTSNSSPTSCATNAKGVAVVKLFKIDSVIRSKCEPLDELDGNSMSVKDDKNNIQRQAIKVKYDLKDRNYKGSIAKRPRCSRPLSSPRTLSNSKPKERKNINQAFDDYLQSKDMQRGKVEGDGNCLFRSISVFSHGNQDRHEEVRSDLYSYFKVILDKFKGRWNEVDCPKDGELLDPEAYFVYKLVNLPVVKYEILEVIGDNGHTINEEKIEKFIEIKRETCNERNKYDQIHWGGITDMHLYALLKKVNVMSITEKFMMVNRDRKKCGFGINLSLIAYRYNINHQEELAHKRCMFLYTNNNHYEPLLNNGSYVWKCNEYYDYVHDTCLVKMECGKCGNN